MFLIFEKVIKNSQKIKYVVLFEIRHNNQDFKDDLTLPQKWDVLMENMS